jgi:FAD/FMN-containing dehydrogenase
MGHTPGPWEHQPALNYVGFSIAPRGTLPTLAAVERPRGEPKTITVKCFNFPGETEANARLIATSPELLDACKAARRAFAELNGQVSREVWNSLYEITRTLDDAIAKATKAD